MDSPRVSSKLTNYVALRGGAQSQEGDSNDNTSNWPYHVAYESIFIETKDKVAHLLHDQGANSTRTHSSVVPVVLPPTSNPELTAPDTTVNVSHAPPPPAPPISTKKSQIVLPTPSPPGTSTTWTTLKKKGYRKPPLPEEVAAGESSASHNALSERDNEKEKRRGQLLWPLRMLERRMGPFVFKGFGFSIAKPFFPMYSLGGGLRIPITSNFPLYDKHIENPRLSSQISCYSTYEETYLRASMSFSLPLQVILYMVAVACSTYLKLYTHDANGGVSLSHLKKIKKIRASDSVKRCGFTMSLRCGTKNGWRWNISPWLFYMPSHAILQKILPLFYACPALGMAIIAILSDIWPSFSEHSKREKHNTGSGSTPHPPTQPGAIATAPASTATITPPGPACVQPRDTLSSYCYRTFRQCRKRVLGWASRHTSALGWNIGCSKTQGKDVSLSSSIAFECQPFFPKWTKISHGWLWLEYVNRYWAYWNASLYRLLDPSAEASQGGPGPDKAFEKASVMSPYSGEMEEDDGIKVRKKGKKKKSKSAHV